MNSLPQNWPNPPRPLVLADGDVDVWRIELGRPDEAVLRARRVLAADEQDRADRFHFAEGRAAYVVCRAAVRSILAGYLGADAASLVFETGPHGKPALAGGALKFNVAHSGGLALCAVSPALELGVDIERRRPLDDLEQVARRYFSARENEMLWRLPADLRQRGFFNAWTRKEAYIKGRGLGLSMKLDQFDVSLTPGEPAQLLASREPGYSADHWRLVELDAPAGYTAALALAGENWRLQRWEYGG